MYETYNSVVLSSHLVLLDLYSDWKTLSTSGTQSGTLPIFRFRNLISFCDSWNTVAIAPIHKTIPSTMS